MPADDLPLKASVLNVFAPVMVIAVAAALVKLTLLNVRPLEAMPDVAPDKLIWLVPTLNVRLPEFIESAVALAFERVTVLAPRFIVLVFPDVELKLEAFTAYPFVVRTPAL